MTHSTETVAAVRRMKAEGVRNAEIAASVGLSPRSVEAICERHGIKRPTAGRIDMALGAQLLTAYRNEAVRRGLPFDRFMRRLLLVIAQDNLFSAIIDE